MLRRAITAAPAPATQRGLRILIEDRQQNPSGYAMMTISEGATMTGGELSLYGETDAYGHRKLGGIGMQTGSLIKQITGVNIITQQVA